MLASIFFTEVVNWNNNLLSINDEIVYETDEKQTLTKQLPVLTDDIFREENEKSRIIDCF